ncbi:MAG: NAD-dependent epimerase/dehydratase family protein [Nitrospira sp.]|nr:NAD-dependent epimerase/dehydratase family protein [Nitrospira sp.]
MSGLSSPILVTGSAGFIGFHVARRLLDRGEIVIGLDNLNDYYDVRLKEARLAQLTAHKGFRFIRLDLANRQGMRDLFTDEPIQRVTCLARSPDTSYWPPASSECCRP